MDFTSKQVEEVMNRVLTPRDARCFKLHFGLIDGRCHTFVEIAREMGFNKARAHQIVSRAIEKINAELERGL